MASQGQLWAVIDGGQGMDAAVPPRSARNPFRLKFGSASLSSGNDKLRRNNQVCPFGMCLLDLRNDVINSVVVNRATFLGVLCHIADHAEQPTP